MFYETVEIGGQLSGKLLLIIIVIIIIIIIITIIAKISWHVFKLNAILKSNGGCRR